MANPNKQVKDNKYLLGKASNITANKKSLSFKFTFDKQVKSKTKHNIINYLKNNYLI